MTRKDYEAIATAIANTEVTWATEATQAMLTLVANRIADVMQADNPRFDRDRFLAACQG